MCDYKKKNVILSMEAKWIYGNDRTGQLQFLYHNIHLKYFILDIFQLDFAFPDTIQTACWCGHSVAVAVSDEYFLVTALPTNEVRCIQHFSQLNLWMQVSEFRWALLRFRTPQTGQSAEKMAHTASDPFSYRGSKSDNEII